MKRVSQTKISGVLVSGDMQLKDAIAPVYRYSLTTGATTGADLETAQGVEKNDQESGDVEIEHVANVPEINNYLIRFEISEE